MTTNHIDTLKEWWENAEVGDPKDGDVIIEWAGDGHAVRTFLEDERDNLYAACTYRILARAPKPKPAWHDGIAVTATATDDLGDEITAVWVREGDELWRSDEGGMVLREDLRDVTPLIEAKVTDEMVERGARASTPTGVRYLRPCEVREVLTAALGLETA